VGRKDRGGRSVIDLAPGEWEQVSDPKLQNKSDPRRRR
jgi:hypothetical protein